MQVVVPDDEFIKRPDSIFLAGPCYRVEKSETWRSKAQDIFENFYGFSGVLYSPEPFSLRNYNAQIEWEMMALEVATVILFWIPRNLDTLPGFTTNIEFGEWMKSGKIVLGYPLGSPHMDYIDYKAKKFGVPVSHTLKETVERSLVLLDKRKRSA